MSQAGFAVSFIVFFSSTTFDLLANAGVDMPPIWTMFALTTLLFVPFAWIRRIGKMKYVNLGADVIILGSVLYLSIVAFQLIGTQGVATNIEAVNKQHWIVFL